MMRLSEHFELSELTRTAQPFPNDPGPVEIKALTTLCAKVLEPIRLHFGRPVRVNSGFRSARVNGAVGSSKASQHRRGEAADIEIDGIANAVLAHWIKDNLAFDQLILEAYRPGIPNSGWVHVSYRTGRLRRSILTMTMGSHGPVYSQGINP
jgi:zinc D-Ala-D-Ala carboxypeptidase